MLKKTLLFLLSLLLPGAAIAGPIVTWEAFGTVNYSLSNYPGLPLPQAPPLGTPYAIELSFDPDARVRTPFSPAGSPCFMTAVTGSFELGGAAYTLSGNAFTNSFLPLSNCAPASPYPPGVIEFFLSPRPVGDDVFNLGLQPRFLDLMYSDLLHQDGTFPTVPTMGARNFLFFNNEDFFEFGGSFMPHAVVDQSTPVPEPATMTLVGVGLALAARRRWRSRSERQL
jgi:hypothetical protein